MYIRRTLKEGADDKKEENYHFTTLSPNLGVVDTENGGFVIADIPGIQAF